MKRLLVTLLMCGILMPVASMAEAADFKPYRASMQGQYLPFPRGEQSQPVWASGACWRDCGSYCAWGLAGCLRQDSQGFCLKLSDTCDRYCQRECRSSGGPLLGLID